MSKRKRQSKYKKEIALEKKQLGSDKIKIKCKLCNDVFTTINTKTSIYCPNCGNLIQLF